ncbi:hypothetical protein ACGFRG_08030 [Streptomyces sp. NPDC048696]|uniref:hypothetical protein n=1 Tax=Streptomyces sp. NPDC048696 TaxID=3365585 RepID=UPI003720EB6C
MIVVYTPPDGEPEQYDARSLRVSEASIVSRTTGQKWKDVVQGLQDEDLDAMRAVVWVIKKRSHPGLRLGDFDPGIEEMVTRWDQDETADFVRRAIALADSDPEVTRDDLDEAWRKAIAAAADPAHAEATIKEMTEAPKDEARSPRPQATDPSPSQTSSPPEAAISDSSPTSSTSLPEPSMT